RKELVLVDPLLARDPPHESGDRGIGFCSADRVVLASRAIDGAGHALIVGVSIAIDFVDLVGLAISFTAWVEHCVVDGGNVGKSRRRQQNEKDREASDHALRSHPQNSGSHAAGSSPRRERSVAQASTVSLRPDKTFTMSGIAERSSRAMTESLPCLTR